MSDRLGLRITRSRDDIIDDLMSYRNQKVESQVEFPANYTGFVHGTGNPVEDAFYQAYAESDIRMDFVPGTEFEYAGELAEAVEQIRSSNTGIYAKIEGIYEHGDAFQQGVDALEQAGFDASLWLESQVTDRSIADVLDGLEDQGAVARIEATESEINHEPDSHYIRAYYDPNTKTFEPDCQVHVPSKANDGDIAELEQTMEEAFDRFGLLE